MSDYNKALDKVYKSIVVDLTDTAYQVESCLEKYVSSLVFPEGIYSRNQLEPILIPGVKYKTSIKGQLHDYFLGQEIAGPVYKEVNGELRLILSTHLVNNQRTMLNNKPILPYYGVKIGLTELNNYISSLVSYNRLGSLSNSDNTPYYEFVRNLESDRLLDIIDDINDIFRENKQTISQFIRGFEEHLVFCTLNGISLRIDIGTDNRALKWIKQEEDKKRDAEAYENI